MRSRIRVGGGYDPIAGFKYGAAILTGLAIGATLIYWLLGQYYDREGWSLFHCLFMVVITLSTIGYGDWLDIRPAPLAQLFTIGLVVIGVAAHAFVISNVTAVLFEGLFGAFLRRRRMQKQIDEMSAHYIVCGAGATGAHCVEELLRTAREFVVVDHDHEQLQRLTREQGDFPYIIGEVDDDDVLLAAGAERAHGLLACLDEDKVNLFVTLSARQLNGNLRIVTKVVEESAAPKMIKAGANDVVSPSAIGGLRMVSAMVRPTVISFLDTMMRDPTQNFRLEELHVEAGSAIDGRSIEQAELRKESDVLVIAARLAAQDHYIYSPAASFVLAPGTTLVVIGRVDDLSGVRQRFAGAAR